MIKRFPVIRDALEYFSRACCPRPGGIKVLHKVPRVAPPLLVNDHNQDFLQAEDGAVILDETDGSGIYDDLRR